MNTRDYSELRNSEIEAECVRQFDVSLTVRRVLFESLQLSDVTQATVFCTTDNTIYALWESEGPVRLGEVQSSLKKAGFRVGRYAAPEGRRDYFEREAFKIFQATYPGRNRWTDDEEAYYQLLVPYSPGLVRLQGVNGPIRRYNQIGKSWQTIYELPHKPKAERVA